MRKSKTPEQANEDIKAILSRTQMQISQVLERTAPPTLAATGAAGAGAKEAAEEARALLATARDHVDRARALLRITQRRIYGAPGAAGARRRDMAETPDTAAAGDGRADRRGVAEALDNAAFYIERADAAARVLVKASKRKGGK